MVEPAAQPSHPVALAPDTPEPTGAVAAAQEQAKPAPVPAASPVPSGPQPQPRPPATEAPSLAVVRPVGQPAAPSVGPAAVPSRPPLVAPVHAPPNIPGPAHLPAPKPLDGAPRPASTSRLKGRHIGLFLSFLLMVLLPLVVSVWYLWARATDQFASTLGFSVHRESIASGISLLSGLSSLSGSSSADTDIIFNYINSQQLVAEIDAEINLRAIWSRPDNDPMFAFDPDGTIEDLVEYWKGMVNVYYDSSTRLIEVRVLAFAPEDAQKIALLIFEKSTVMINQLNDIAAEDSVRYAAEELAKTRDDLILARQEMLVFRNKYQFVDPATDVMAQSSLVASMQQQLAQALIDMDILKETAPPNDPRITTLERRIRVVEARIEAEKAKLGGGAGEEAFADIMADYERLLSDRQFAEAAYQVARAAHEQALSEARRQSRYLAAHIQPTLAESSRFPERGLKLAVLGVFLAMIWAIGSLIFYSVRDRR